MVKAMIDIKKRTNQVLNIVKAQNGFNNKSDAIDFVVQVYENDYMEPELKPEYVKKLMKIKKQKGIKVGSIKDFKKRYGI